MAELAEAFITEAALSRVESTGMLAKTKDPSEPRAAELQAELDGALAQSDELAEVYGAGKLSMREWLVARKPLDTRVRKLKKELSRYTRTAPVADYIDVASLRSDWEGLDLTRRRAIIKAVLDHVIVGAGRQGYNRFDPKRLDAVWGA